MRTSALAIAHLRARRRDVVKYTMFRSLPVDRPGHEE